MRQIPLGAKGSFNLLVQPEHLANRWKRVPGHFCRRLGDSLRRLPRFIESFNGRLRDELLNETLFRSLPHARAALEAWRYDYNEKRPHSKLGWMTPRAYANAFSGEAIHKTETSNQSRTLVIPG
jgi:integrase-like protein